ncbi:hypothetical protein KFE25_001268 [Diacronema lutheri]|uniref:Uncharacterized protein n=1 Tax=Diacronema lutheri TaxID=2081491 RepID=A0A8J5XMC0_DIALT|nr:hypothetical protein KFE25_001268 [Diacronema lutheri]
MERVASARVSTFLNSRPETPRTVRSWLAIHPAHDVVVASGLGKLLDELLLAVFSDMPADIRQYLLDKLAGTEPGPSAMAQARYLSSHDVRGTDTNAALPRYVAEARVMEFFVAVLEAAIAELNGTEHVPPTDWLKQHLQAAAA